MGKVIDVSKHPSDWEPMKYWSMGASLSSEQRQEKLLNLLMMKQWIFSEKYDGDLCRIIWDEGEVLAQSRSISKKTGTYGDLTNKLMFIDNILHAFSDTTVLIGEVYLPGGTSKEVGTILRCLDDKALARQKNSPVKYYIFDILMYEGKDLTTTPMIDRITYLKLAAEKINSDLVSYAKYYEANENTFFNHLSKVFQKNGEGVVLYKKTMLPCEGRTSAWETVKIKRELEVDVDCFIYGIEPAEKNYTGKELSTWQYWMDDKTGEKFLGSYYLKYCDGGMIIPISKGYYYNWPGAIKCAVYDENHNPIVLCKCSGLTEEMKTALRDNYDEWHMCPVKVSGMMLSVDKNGIYSIRHPKLVSVRKNDIDVEDCTITKIIGG